MTASLIIMIVSMFLFAILSFVSKILIAVWIYKDAKKRNMEATLWTLLAIFIPSYIGVIIYLVFRDKNKVYVCPRCGGEVDSDYAICPSCSLQLQRVCPQCGLRCEETWHNCPRCSLQLEPLAYPMAKPQQKKDHLVRNIVLLIVANVVALIGIYAGAFTFLFNNADLMVDEFEMPYVEEYDDFEVFPSDIQFDIK